MHGDMFGSSADIARSDANKNTSELASLEKRIATLEANLEELRKLITILRDIKTSAPTDPPPTDHASSKH